MDHQCKLKTAIVKSVLNGMFKDNIALLFRRLLGCFVTCPCRRVLGTERQKFQMSPLAVALTRARPQWEKCDGAASGRPAPHLPQLSSQFPGLWGPGIRSTQLPHGLLFTRPRWCMMPGQTQGCSLPL